MSTRIVPISKYAGYDDELPPDDPYFDDEDSPEVMDKVVGEYEALGDISWREKKDFLDKIQGEYAGEDLGSWAKEMEDELIDEATEQVWSQLEPIAREVANEMGGGENDELYYEEITDRIYLKELANNIVFKLWRGKDNYTPVKEEDELAVMKEELDKAIQGKQSDILYGVQEDLRSEIDTETLTDTVRFMETPEESEMVEVPTKQRELENLPSDPNLGSYSANKNNRTKRGGKMLTELFKLAQTLDKKGEYELASEVDAIIKELSQRAGLTTEEMISLANDLDANGDTDLADKLDSVLAKKSK